MILSMLLMCDQVQHVISSKAHASLTSPMMVSRYSIRTTPKLIPCLSVQYNNEFACRGDLKTCIQISSSYDEEMLPETIISKTCASDEICCDEYSCFLHKLENGDQVVD